MANSPTTERRPTPEDFAGAGAGRFRHHCDQNRSGTLVLENNGAWVTCSECGITYDIRGFRAGLFSADITVTDPDGT